MVVVCKSDINLLNNVLGLLNRVTTSVEFKDGKYIVMQNDARKYEITMTDTDTQICEFNSDGYAVNLCMVEKQGISVRYKLWWLKFILCERIDTKPFDKFAQRVDGFTRDIRDIIDIKRILKRDDTRVEVLDKKTRFIKFYSVSYTVDSGTGFKTSYKLVITYACYIVCFGKNCAVYQNICGVRGLMLKMLRRALDEKVVAKDY